MCSKRLIRQIFLSCNPNNKKNKSDRSVATLYEWAVEVEGNKNAEPTCFLMFSNRFSISFVRLRSATKSLFSMMRVCSSRASFVSAVWRTSDTLTEFYCMDESWVYDVFMYQRFSGIHSYARSLDLINQHPKMSLTLFLKPVTFTHELSLNYALCFYEIEHLNVNLALVRLPMRDNQTKLLKPT